MVVGGRGNAKFPGTMKVDLKVKRTDEFFLQLHSLPLVLHVRHRLQLCTPLTFYRGSDIADYLRYGKQGKAIQPASDELVDHIYDSVVIPSNGLGSARFPCWVGAKRCPPLHFGSNDTRSPAFSAIEKLSLECPLECARKSVLFLAAGTSSEQLRVERPYGVGNCQHLRRLSPER
jgi:hypothetical protein